MNKEYKRIYEEINYLRDDVGSSEIKQTTPYINGKIMVKEPKKHLLNHINTIEQYVALTLTPLTADEIVKELNELFSNGEWYYDEVIYCFTSPLYSNYFSKKYIDARGLSLKLAHKITSFFMSLED